MSGHKRRGLTNGAQPGRVVLHAVLWLVQGGHWSGGVGQSPQTNQTRSHHTGMERAHQTSPRGTGAKLQFCSLTNQIRSDDGSMRDAAIPAHATPTCAIVSATPLARDEMTEIQANGNTPRRSARTVIAEGVSTGSICFKPSYRDCLPGGIRLTRSLRTMGGRVNVPRRGRHTPGSV